MEKRQFRRGRGAQAQYPTRETWRRGGLAAGAGALLALSAVACDLGSGETTGGVAVLPSEDAGTDGGADAGLPDAGADAGLQSPGGVAPEPDGGE